MLCFYDRWHETKRARASRLCRRRSALVRTESESEQRQLQMQQIGRDRSGSGILRFRGVTAAVTSLRTYSDSSDLT